MRPNLCKLEILNECLEIEFTNKGRQRGEGDKEEREGKTD